MIIDLGCGNSPKGDINCDLKHYESKVENFVLCDIHYLPFRDKTFEEACCTEVFEHIYSHNLVLKETKRILKNGGILMLSVPNIFYWRAILRWIIEGTTNIMEAIFYSWTVNDITNILKANGFNIIQYDFIHYTRFSGRRPFISKVLPKRIGNSSIVVRAQSMEKV